MLDVKHVPAVALSSVLTAYESGSTPTGHISARSSPEVCRHSGGL
jgi:hypothetical protein